MSTLPPFHAHFRPVLEVLSDGRERGVHTVVDEVAVSMRLTDEQRAETIPSGQGRLVNRVLWALS